MESSSEQDAPTETRLDAVSQSSAFEMKSRMFAFPSCLVHIAIEREMVV